MRTTIFFLLFAAMMAAQDLTLKTPLMAGPVITVVAYGCDGGSGLAQYRAITMETPHMRNFRATKMGVTRTETIKADRIYAVYSDQLQLGRLNKIRSFQQSPKSWAYDRIVVACVKPHTDQKHVFIFGLQAQAVAAQEK